MGVRYVEAFEYTVKLLATPGFAFAFIFCAEGVGPESGVSGEETIDEVVRCVAKLLQGGDQRYRLGNNEYSTLGTKDMRLQQSRYGRIWQLKD